MLAIRGGECRRRRRRCRQFGDQARQSGNGRRAGTSCACRAAGGDAGRTDAAALVGCRRRHPRQNHHHVDGGGAARRRRYGPDRHQRRHHQCLRHQCPTWTGRMDGRRGGRVRRLLHQTSSDDLHRDQHRSGAYGALRIVRETEGGFPDLRAEHSVLRFRGAVHRRPGCAGPDREDRGSPGHHLRVQPAGRDPRDAAGSDGNRVPVQHRRRYPRRRPLDHRGHGPADVRAAQRPECPGGDRRLAGDGDQSRGYPRPRSPVSPA